MTEKQSAAPEAAYPAELIKAIGAALLLSIHETGRRYGALSYCAAQREPHGRDTRAVSQELHPRVIQGPWER